MKKDRSKNILWEEFNISRAQREARSGHKGLLLWLTGLSGSGKSTIARGLQRRLFDQGKCVYVLDGDNIRHGLNGDLGFSSEDRTENIRRIGEVGKLFVDAGFIVIAAFISPYINDRQKVRSLMGDGRFLEIYVNVDLLVCEQRDVKGLYQKAKSGEIQDFTGISSPYEPPIDPDIEIKTGNQSVEESIQTVFQELMKRI